MHRLHPPQSSSALSHLYAHIANFDAVLIAYSNFEIMLLHCLMNAVELVANLELITYSSSGVSESKAGSIRG